MPLPEVFGFNLLSLPSPRECKATNTAQVKAACHWMVNALDFSRKFSIQFNLLM